MNFLRPSNRNTSTGRKKGGKDSTNYRKGRGALGEVKDLDLVNKTQPEAHGGARPKKNIEIKGERPFQSGVPTASWGGGGGGGGVGASDVRDRAGG